MKTINLKDTNKINGAFSQVMSYDRYCSELPERLGFTYKESALPEDSYSTGGNFCEPREVNVGCYDMDPTGLTRLKMDFSRHTRVYYVEPKPYICNNT